MIHASLISLLYFLFLVFLDNSKIEAVGLHVLIGPSLANLSLLRLLLLINIVSASKLSSYFHSPWSLIQLSLGPLLGLARLYFTNYNQRPQTLDLNSTFDGLEAFWDFGCCLLYLCLKILVFLTSKKSTFRGRNDNGEKIEIQMKLQPQTPRWSLITNDGYLLTVSASLACRGCILVVPLTSLAWIMPIVLFLDLRAQLMQDVGQFYKAHQTSSLSSIYVTTASKTTSLCSNSSMSMTKPSPR